MGNPRILIATVLLLHAVSVGRCAESSPIQAQIAQAQIAHAQISHSQTARLNPDLAPEQYEYREWTINDGLPSDQVLDIVQTHDGYLWLATERGLARFDGLNFTTFNRSNTPAFVTNRITKLCKGRDGTLWIGTQRGGLIRCRFGQPPKFQRFDELLGKQIRCLLEDRAGTLWIGTATETWTVTDGVCAPRRGAPLNVLAICEDRNGKLWLGSSIWMGSKPDSLPSSDVEPRPGLYRLDEDRFYQLTEADGFSVTESDNSITALCADQQGGLWIGTLGKPLLHYQDGKFEDHAMLLGPKASQYTELHLDRGGQLWVGTFSAGGYRLVGDKAARVPLGPRPIRGLVEDRDGNIWFGGGHRGLRSISNPEVTKLVGPGNGATIRCVIEDSAGDLWFGSGNSVQKSKRETGLHRLRGGVFEHFGIDHGLPTHLVTGIAEGPDGRLWIGTHQGLVCRENEKLTTFTTEDGLGRNWIRAVFADGDGVVWIGFWEGSVQRMQSGSFTTIAEFGDSDVNWFHEDASGVVWIGSNRGLYRWLDGQLERVSDIVLDQLPTIDFTACFEDDEGSLWLGTDGGGLCRYSAGRFSNWTSEHGLHEDTIHAIAEDNHGRLWLGGPHGLTSLSVKSLEAFDVGTLNRLDVRVHEIRVGNNQPRIGLEYQPKVVRRDNGSIVLVTTGGAVVVPPGGTRQPAVPPLVHIEGVHVNGDSHALNETIEIRSGSRHIDFHFTANTFAAPERAQFRYRLDGYDDVWIAAESQRSASYTDVPPGRYVFRVTADNGYDIWSEEHAAIGLTVTPRWWEITWLRVAALLASIAAVIGYFRHRTRQVRKANIALRREITERQRAEEESRINAEQLARVSRAASLGELTTSIAHEVKQPLFAIVSNAQTARRLLDRPPPDLHEIGDALNDIVEDGNRAADIIDRVRGLLKKEHQPSEHLNLEDVARDAIRFAEPEVHRLGLTIGTEFASDLPPIRGDAVELQQVVLNLLINGAQAMSDLPSDSRTLIVRTSGGDGSVELAVQDCGVGVAEDQFDRLFEPFYTTKPDGTGMGLAINRTIIEAHGGNIWATPNADRGMTFHVRLPAAGETVS